MYLRAGFGIACVAVFAMLVMPEDGVREIHNADKISNFALVEPRPHANDWPWSRGTDGRNVVPSAQIQKQWIIGSSGAWQLTSPGTGQATPIIWGDQLILLTAETDGQRISLRSIDRTTGRDRWWTTIHQDSGVTIADKKPTPLSTPACDGHFVYVATAKRGKLWITSVDMTGRISWQREAGPFAGKNYYAPSPVLFQSLVIVASDGHRNSHLTALHRQTGEIIWRIRRPDGESFGSPVVTTLAGQHQLILGGKKAVCSYDPATGSPLWIFRWSAERVSNSVAFDSENVFVTSGQPLAEVVCIKADGTGDVTETHRVWSQSKSGSEYPSPVHHAGLLYVLADDGLLKCIEAATGKTEWRKRLPGTFTASPIIAGDYLICCSNTGQSYILQTGLSSEIVAENSLPDGIKTSPIITSDSIYVQTDMGVHRIVMPAAEPVVEKPDRPKRRL